MSDDAEFPTTFWLIDMGETNIRCDYENAMIVDALLGGSGSVRITDLYGGTLILSLPHVKFVYDSTQEMREASTRHTRAMEKTINDAVAADAPKEWES